MAGPDFAVFMHFGSARDPKLVQTAMALLEEFPDSSYHPGLRWALKGYYRRNELDLRPEERARLRSLLGITDVLFPEDKRLDVKVRVVSPQLTRLEGVAALVSRESGVPLAVDDILKPELSFYRHSERVWTLREWMKCSSLPDLPVIGVEADGGRI
jgi:hypothetical protein